MIFWFCFCDLILSNGNSIRSRHLLCRSIFRTKDQNNPLSLKDGRTLSSSNNNVEKRGNISCSLNIKNTNVASNYVGHNTNKCLFICFSSVSSLKTFGKHCLIYKFLFLLKACWFLFILRYLRLLQAEGHSPLFELSLNSTLQLEVNQFY